ncbi:melanization interactin protein [Penaeus vannamei]|uniref:Melanization interactin protein n=1 Tax=Penaeus vannamei TaxID=6689 RepID=A0A3R7QTS7_PENVA|nr:melanization interactin protein [Penaeus vannamei]
MKGSLSARLGTVVDCCWCLARLATRCLLTPARGDTRTQSGFLSTSLPLRLLQSIPQERRSAKTLQYFLPLTEQMIAMTQIVAMLWAVTAVVAPPPTSPSTAGQLSPLPPSCNTYTKTKRPPGVASPCLTFDTLGSLAGPLEGPAFPRWMPLGPDLFLGFIRVDQQLSAILSTITENHNQLQATIRDIGRMVRRTHREITDLREDTDLILGKMYKPSCQDIAEGQPDHIAGKNQLTTEGGPSQPLPQVRCELGRGAIGWTVIWPGTTDASRSTALSRITRMASEILRRTTGSGDASYGFFGWPGHAAQADHMGASPTPSCDGGLRRVQDLGSVQCVQSGRARGRLQADGGGVRG